MAFLEPKPRSDDRITADALGQMRKAIPAQFRGGDGIDISRFGDRLTLEAKNSSLIPLVTLTIKQFIVLEEFDDYLKCGNYIANADSNGWWKTDPFDGSPNDNPADGIVYVAKPYWLQKTPWDGQTVELDDGTWTYSYTDIGERERTGGNITQTQSIVENYLVGDIITAVKKITGYQDPDQNVPIIWEDINSAGRTWQIITTNGTNGIGSTATLRVLELTVDSTSQMWDARIQVWNDGTPAEPTDGPPCWVVAPNGGPLYNATLPPGSPQYYEGTCRLIHSDKRPVYSVAGTVVNVTCIGGKVQGVNA